MFKVYVYLELVEEGRLTDPHDVANLLVLKQMNSKMSFVCVGVSNYSAFQQSLGYTTKTVNHVSLPFDTARLTKCSRICVRTSASESKNYSASESKNYSFHHHCLSLRAYLEG